MTAMALSDRLLLRIEPDLKVALWQLADRRGTTASDLVRAAIQELVRQPN